MSTALVNAPAAVPTRPWNRRRNLVIRNVAVAAVSLFVVWILNARTELAGFLGSGAAFVAVFPVVSLLASAGSGRNVATDRFMGAVVLVGSMVVAVPLYSIVRTVWDNGSKAFHASYLTQDMRITASSDALDMGGALHAITGTLVMLALATLISVPLGVMSAVYIVEVKGRFAGIVRFLTQAMSGVPSIVAGLFVYATIVIYLTGFSAWAGALAYMILMLPTVSRTSEEVLRLVPEELRAASYALGASQARTVFRVVLPTVKSGLVTAAILGIARVAGETAPLILTSSYFVATSTNLNEPMASLPIYIFSSLGLGDANATTRAWGGSLVLLALVLVLFLTARVFSSRLNRK